MSGFESLSHSRWNCKYHLVFVPKCRKKELFGKIRTFLGPVFHDLAADKGSKILEGHMLHDHIHMMIKIPPKYAVSIGYWLYKRQKCHCSCPSILRSQTEFSGEKFWSRGYAVSTVGFEESQVRKYIRDQEDRDNRSEEGRSVLTG